MKSKERKSLHSFKFHLTSPTEAKVLGCPRIWYQEVCVKEEKEGRNGMLEKIA